MMFYPTLSEIIHDPLIINNNNLMFVHGHEKINLFLPISDQEIIIG